MNAARSGRRYAVLHRIGTVQTAAARARKIAIYAAMLDRGAALYG